MADIQQVNTSSAVIITGKGILKGIIASNSAASSQATLTCYDNTAASGRVIFQVEVYAEAEPMKIFFADQYAPRFTTGLYLAIDTDMIVNIWASER